MNVKKLLAVILAVVMLLGALPVVFAAPGESANPEDGDISVDLDHVEEIPEETEPAGLLGDINNDGAIGTPDLLALQAYISGKTALPYPELADITGDGSVGAPDLLALQAHLSGKSPIQQ